MLTVVGVAGCAGRSTQPESATIGETPTLVAQRTSLIPAIKVVTAVDWDGEEQPVAAPGLHVTPFARLDHPRWLHVLPNGDVLVAETNAPERPGRGTGRRAAATK